MSSSKPVIYTVGHSNLPMAAFVDLLRKHQIDVLIDVRSKPYSKYVSHFNGSELRAAVELAGFKYVFLGTELGGQPDGEQFYDAGGHAEYGVIARSPGFCRALAQVEALALKSRVAIMCSEEDPTECHRHLLVGRVLLSKGVEVRHIRRDGQILSGEHLRQTKDEQLSFFGEGNQPAWKSTRSVSPRRRQPHSSPS